MSEHPTKERILDAAEDIMIQKSFHSVGLSEILKAVNIPKGSFYHHFASKEAFGVELIRHYSNQALKEHCGLLLNKEVEPNARLRLISHYDSAIANFIENDGKCPCLILKLASEVGSASSSMREEVSKVYAQRKELYTGIITEGLEKGHISSSRSASSIADLMISIWLGSVIQALSHQKADTLRTTLNFIASDLIPSGESVTH